MRPPFARSSPRGRARHSPSPNLAFEDVNAFQVYRYPFGETDPSADTFIAHDDGVDIKLIAFVARYQGDGFPRTIDIDDSGWYYLGP